MNDTERASTILVLGGTGKTGRRIVDRLKERDLPVRIGSRYAEPPFDWNDTTTWTPALHGVGAVYIAYYPDIALPGAVDSVRAFANAAVAAGVERLVLLSGRGEEEAQAAERVVQSAGADWTIVRASWFNQNFSEDYLLDPVRGGQVILPAGDVPEPFIDADDIATATGREIAFVPVTHTEYADALAATDDVPNEIAELVMYLFTTVLDGRNSHLGDGVQRALHREPRDFADFAWDTAQRGVWDPT